MKEIFTYVLESMLTLAKVQNNHFSYCMHSSVYRVFLSSGRFVDSNLLILFRHMTTGPENTCYTELCVQYVKLE